MKSFTLKVEPRGGDLYSRYRGRLDSRGRAFIEAAGLKVPRTRYRVRYALDEKGPLLSGGDFVQAKWDATYVVCFMPQDWRDKRITRTLLPWEGK
jgi:hypothetical protein